MKKNILMKLCLLLIISFITALISSCGGGTTSDTSTTSSTSGNVSLGAKAVSLNLKASSFKTIDSTFTNPIWTSPTKYSCWFLNWTLIKEDGSEVNLFNKSVGDEYKIDIANNNEVNTFVNSVTISSGTYIGVRVAISAMDFSLGDKTDKINLDLSSLGGINVRGEFAVIRDMTGDNAPKRNDILFNDSSGNHYWMVLSGSSPPAFTKYDGTNTRPSGLYTYDLSNSFDTDGFFIDSSITQVLSSGKRYIPFAQKITYNGEAGEKIILTFDVSDVFIADDKNSDGIYTSQDAMNGGIFHPGPPTFSVSFE